MQNSPSSPKRVLSKPHIATLILLAGLSALGMNLHLAALPSMSSHFEVDYRVMQLSVSLYLAGNAVVQIFVGPISDQMGRRPVLLASMALFLVATVEWEAADGRKFSVRSGTGLLMGGPISPLLFILYI